MRKQFVVKIFAGKTVMSTSRSGRKLNVDISGLKSGSYFLQISNKGTGSTLKFVKQ